MPRAIGRSLARPERAEIKHMGVDEKAIAKCHRYATQLNDLLRGTVLEVTEGRSNESIEKVPGQRAGRATHERRGIRDGHLATVLPSCMGAIDDGASKRARSLSHAFVSSVT